MEAHISAYDVILTFGKHRGRTLGEIAEFAPEYITWAAQQYGIPTDWRLAFTRMLRGQPVYDLNLPRKSKGVEVKKIVPTEGPTPGKVRFNTAEDGYTVVVRFPYNKANPADVERKDTFKQIVDSATWSKTHYRWEISPTQVAKAVDYFGGTTNCEADEQVKQWYREEIGRRLDLDAIRVKDDTEFEIPTLVPLYPYQKVGVEFINRAEGRALVADQMGLGKTATAIGYAVLHKLKTLVVCPKAVKIGWKREIMRFAGVDAAMWDGNIIDGNVDAQFHVINYDVVDRHLELLNTLGFELLVGDEATYVKNKKSKRAKAFLKGLHIPKAILLTGTPVMNRPLEAFTLLNFLDAERFGSEWQFMQRYGGAREEPRNLLELHNRTKDLIIRRLKSEVQKELPPKQRNDLFVEMSPAEEREYHKLMNHLIRSWRTSGNPSVTEIPAIQKFLFEIKKHRIIEMVNELLEQGRSVLLFSVYRDQMEWVAKHYAGISAHLDGTMSEKRRQDAIDRLRDGKATVGCLTLGAGGMGIDGLQHSIDTVIFCDQWFVPAWHEQGEDRVHRTGQTKQVSIFYALVANTIDEDMRSILMEKQSIIDETVDGRLISAGRTKGFFKEFVARIKKQQQLDDIGDPVEIEVAA